MDDYIKITYLNDFIFCPVSIYFHNLYGNMDKNSYQSELQLIGTAVHRSIDNHQYSNKNAVLQGTTVCSSKYNLVGKIDVFNIETGELVERKKKIKTIYDG